MRNPKGYLIGQGPEGPVHERDTFTCGHCNKIKVVEPFQRPEDLGGHCKQCDTLICPECYAEGTCTPFLKKLEQHEKKQYVVNGYV